MATLFLVGYYPVDLDAFKVGRGDNTSSHFENILQVFVVFELENGWMADVSGHPDKRTDDGNMDGVARLKAGVVAAVAIQEKVIEIDGADHFAVAQQLNVAQTSGLGRTSCGNQGAENGGEGVHRIGARGIHLTDDVNLDRA